MYCTGCGSKLKKGVSFCTKCGTKAEMDLDSNTISIEKTDIKKVIAIAMAVILVIGIFFGISQMEIGSNGEEKYVCIYTYNKEGQISEIYEYDENGFLLSATEYNSYYGIPAYFEKFEYDSKGNISKYEGYMPEYEYGYDEMWVTYKYDIENCETISERNYEYDYELNQIAFDDMEGIMEGINLPIEGIEYDREGEIIQTATLETDEHGNIISGKAVYNEDKKNSSDWESIKFIREYDEAGNEISVICYGDDVFQSHYKYQYDDRQNIVKESSYRKDKTLYNYTTYSYDEDNRLTEKIEYDSHGNTKTKEFYLYDKNGNKIRKDVIQSSSDWWEVYDYDENGNMIRKERFNEDGDSQNRYTYIYDENNNLKEVNGVFYRYVSLKDYLKNKEKYEQEIAEMLGDVEGKIEEYTKRFNR